jgi:hypothetical protein
VVTTVAVTGAEGLIGRRVVDLLLEDPGVDRVLALDVGAPRGADRPGLERRRADVTDRAVARHLDGRRRGGPPRLRARPVAGRDGDARRQRRRDAQRVRGGRDRRGPQGGLPLLGHRLRSAPRQPAPARRGPADPAEHPLQLRRAQGRDRALVVAVGRGAPRARGDRAAPVHRRRPGGVELHLAAARRAALHRGAGHKPPLQFVHVDDVAARCGTWRPRTCRGSSTSPRRGGCPSTR